MSGPRSGPPPECAAGLRAGLLHPGSMAPLGFYQDGLKSERSFFPNRGTLRVQRTQIEQYVEFEESKS